jgi:phosphoribosylformylglycinamidine synthase II
MTNAAVKEQTAPDFNEPEITPEVGAEFGLNAEEFALMLDIVGRTPSFTELGIFSVMWSEHCSYKSSRLHLKKLPTEAPWVIQGPGENAGVIDIGDGQAAIFKMESHNHPSYIEPFQGAATGVGGIMRDVFTMGARPIANINALRFGDPSHPKTKHLVDGVVAGISHYGNCMGVPTVGGETQFHNAYNGNILVNAMNVGVAEQDKIYYARGASPDQPVVYVGSKTGRDGIHGATMASAEFEDGVEGNRPTVQVGDPFTEKLLLEACLELMQEDMIISIQDMGAAGLTSSSVEIADKGGIGVELDLDKVPQREPNMSPYEIMLSESQERMLMILQPGKEDAARAIFEKWDLDFAVIGRTTDDKHLRLNMYGKTWCDIPVPPLVDDAPIYDRKAGYYKLPDEIDNAAYPLRNDSLADTLKTLISCPDIASKRWIWEQYDRLVMGNTKYSSGQSDAAIVKVNDKKALAISSDCNPRYCKADPVQGGRQAVAESYRNICATGAKPLAVTNNLNFGNPEREDIMAQFVGCLEGMGEACKKLEYPVISGNVSLYNETSGEAILPTPVIGGVGLIEDWEKALPLAFQNDGDTIILVGEDGSHLGQSLYLKEVHGKEEGPAPHVDLEREYCRGAFIQILAEQGLINACHDISDGGLLVTLAEMAMAGHKGAELIIKNSDAPYWLGEDQARYVVTTNDIGNILALPEAQKTKLTILGKTGGKDLKFENGEIITVEELIELNERWLPDYMTS